jgi:hypothetical protein
MQRASRILGSMKNSDVSAEDIACATWARSVGKRIAAHTRAARLVRTKLVVEVEDAVWRGNLLSLTPHIVRNLAESIGPGIVTELEFRIIPQRREPQRAQSSVTRPLDDADQIADPVLRTIYRAARARGQSAEQSLAEDTKNRKLLA